MAVTIVAVNSLQRYLTALEEEQRNVQELAKETEATFGEVLEYKDDMIGKIQVSRMQLSRLESGLGGIFNAPKGKGGGRVRMRLWETASRNSGY
jgi:hypothetical protein